MIWPSFKKLYFINFNVGEGKRYTPLKTFILFKAYTPFKKYYKNKRIFDTKHDNFL